MSVQIIEKNGRPEWAVIAYTEYCKMQEALEDAEDRRDIEQDIMARQHGEAAIVPGEVTFAVLDGTTTYRAWRQHRNMRLKDLASRVGISSAYLSQIENGKRNPALDTLKKMARILSVDVDMLI